MKIIVFDSNYADEFDVTGFRIVTDEEAVKYINSIAEAFKRTDENIEWYFGSNEYVEFESEDEILNCITIKDITSDEFKFLKSLFNLSDEFGHIPDAFIFDEHGR